MPNAEPCWAVLPARHGSSRLPGKVLADIEGRSMLEHVWRRACQAGLDRVLIATDDPRVAAVAEAFGAEVVRTGPEPSGTHRVAAAIRDVSVSVINVQADQPLLDPEHLVRVRDRLRADGGVATLCAPWRGDLADRARVKVTVDGQGRAVRFSRDPLPDARLHIGIYGFGPGWVARCVAAPAGADDDSLEQVAWLRIGVPIRVDGVDGAGPSVDTPEDLARVRALFRERARGTDPEPP